MFARLKAYGIVTAFLTVLVVLSACSDNNLTGPSKTKESYLVTVSSNGVREAYVSVGYEAWLDIQSSVVGKSALENADHFTVKIDSLLTMIRMSDVNYITSIYINNVEMPMVVHTEAFKLKAGDKPGVAWFRFESKLDPSKKDSIRVTVLPLGTKG